MQQLDEHYEEVDYWDLILTSIHFFLHHIDKDHHKQKSAATTWSVNIQQDSHSKKFTTQIDFICL